MNNYQSALKRGLDDEEGDVESQKLLSYNNSTPGRFDYDWHKSSSQISDSGSVSSKFCECFKIIVGSLVSLILLSIMFMVFQKQLMEKYDKVISTNPSNIFYF